jgi:formylglycine-generating enzyme required for sulfatase activity/WD40 repeat protein
LKPANILLQKIGGPRSNSEKEVNQKASDFELKIADFGLAKFDRLLGTLPISVAGATQTGMILGTPSYMSPEQASGTIRNIGPVTDVYALGAILYEMLTGRPPFQGESILDTLQQVQFQEPVHPSRLQPKVPRDLETICLKCLLKKSTNRYGSALELAEDLDRFIRDRPIRARRSSPSERAWRWCRRNPVVASLTGSVVLLLAILLATSLINNARLEEQLGKLERAEKEKTDKLWDSYLVSARASRWSGRPGRRFDGLDAIRRAAAIRTDLQLRNEAIALLTLPDVRIARELPDGYPPGTTAIAFDPDFAHYARSDSKGNICVRGTDPDQEVQNLPGIGTHAWLMKFSPDGRYLSALYNEPGVERIWDWRHAHVVLEREIAGGIEFGPAGDQASEGQKDGHIAIWDLAKEKIVKRLRVGAPRDGGYQASFDPSGRLLAVCVDPPEVRIFDITTEKVIRTLNVAQFGRMVWEPRGQWLSHFAPDQITVWNAQTWTRQSVLKTPDSNTTAVDFGEGCGLLAGTGWDQVLRLWDPATGRELLTLHGCIGTQFKREGARLAATRDGSAIHIWEVTPSGPYRVLHAPLGPGYRTWGAVFSTDGTKLAQFDDNCASIWNVANGRTIAVLPTDMCAGAVFAPDGRALFTRSASGLERWPITHEISKYENSKDESRDSKLLRTGPPQLLANLPWEIQFGTLAPSPHGKLLANLREEALILLFDPQDPSSEIKLLGYPDSGPFIAASPDGRWIANTSYYAFPDKLRVSDARSRQVVWTSPVATAASFSPDSRWLVTGGDACRIWETGIWRLDRTFASPPGLGAVVHAVFAPDGMTLAIAHEARVVRLVDAGSGEELASLAAPDMPHVDRLTFSDDGGYLACNVEKVGVQLWDLRTLRQQLAEVDLDWERDPLSAAPVMQETIKEAVVDDGNATPPPENLTVDEMAAMANQQTWSNRLGAPAQITNSIGMTLRLMPHKSQPYYCSTMKVTVGQFRLFVNETGYQTTAESSKKGGVKVFGDPAGQLKERKPEYVWNHPEIARGEDHPVTLVTWQDAKAFCEWLNKREGRTGHPGGVYRLPTLAEWQWAAKAGTRTVFYFGDDIAAIDKHSWYGKNSNWHTHPVGQKESNPWGLYDIYGNVWDICYTWRKGGREVMPDQLERGPGPNDQTILLGGSYGDGVGPVEYVAKNNGNLPQSHIGFRVIRVGDIRSASKQWPTSKSE